MGDLTVKYDIDLLMPKSFVSNENEIFKKIFRDLDKP
jgi:hypothetical protein